MSATSDGKDFETRITADPQGFEAGMQRAKRAAMEGSDSIKGAMKGIGDTVLGVQKYIVGFTAALAGAVGIKKLVDDTAAMTEQAMDLQRALGGTTNQASALQATLEDVGASPEEFAAAAKGMAKQLRENEGALNDMGLATRDASGQLRPMTDLVMDGIGILNEYREGTDRNIAGTQLFGKGMEAGSKLLLLNRDAMAENAAAVRELGLEVGANAVTAWKAFDAAGDRAALSLRGITKAAGDQLMPVMTDVVQMFNAVAPAAITVIRGALGGLTTAWLGLRNGVVLAWETINAMVISVAEPVLALGEALVMVMSGDFKGATQRMLGVGDNIANAWDNAMKRMVQSSRTTQDQIAALWTPDTQAGSGGGATGTRTATVKPVKAERSTAAAPQSRMAEWEAALADDKVAIEKRGVLEGQYRQMSKAEEATYWRELLARQDTTEAERLALRRKSAGAELASIKETFEARVAALQAEGAEWKNNTDEKLRVERQVQSLYAAGTKEYEASAKRITDIQRQAAEQRAQLATLQVEAERDAALQSINLMEQQHQLALALGLVNMEQVLQAEAQFEQRRHDLAVQALQQRLQAMLADPDRSPVEVERIHQQIEQLEQQHQLRMGQIKGQLQVEGNRYLTDGVNGIAQTFEGVVQRIGTSVRTLSDLFKASMQGLAQIGLQVLAKIVGDWVRQQLMMKLLGKGMALGKIAEEAAKAGAGGTASMAAAPFPLNLTAPAFGASMAAAAMAFAPAASAAGGFDIPGSVNPVVQAHAREMVLPAPLADGFRQIIANGAGSGQAPAPVEFKATPMPGGFFMAHRDEFAKVLRTLHREFKLQG